MDKSKRLYRSRKQRMIAGVCGGIAEHFNIDPTIVRIIAVILLFATSFVPAFVVYIVMWAIIPEAPTTNNQPKAKLANSKPKTAKPKTTKA